MTPTLSCHARERCAQMDVRTRRVKAILRDPDLTYFSRDARVAWRHDDPTLAVVYVEADGRPHAVTVLPRTQERYRRPDVSDPLGTPHR